MRRTAWLLILCFVLMLTSCTGQGDDAASLSTTASSTETATTGTTTTSIATETPSTTTETTVNITTIAPTATTITETPTSTTTTGSAEAVNGVYFNDGVVAAYVDGASPLKGYVAVTEATFREEYDLNFAPFLNEKNYDIEYELAYERDEETFEPDVSRFAGCGEVTFRTNDGNGRMSLRITKKVFSPYFIAKTPDGGNGKKSLIGGCKAELFNVEDSFLVGTFRLGEYCISCYAEEVTQAELADLLLSVIENYPHE